MIFTIIQVVLLILILVAVVPNVVRTFRTGKLKLGLALLLPLLAILFVISSIHLHASIDHQAVDPKILEKIDQLDAANVDADVQRFRKDHPEIKNGFQPKGLTEDGIGREFDSAMMSADVPALSRICKKISEDRFSGVTIKTITDNARICGITHLQKLGDSKIAVDAGPQWDAIYQYEMTDSSGKPFGVMSYLAVSWNKKSGAWALESAISTGRFFRIEKKP
jgi:hypothetical protein